MTAASAAPVTGIDAMVLHRVRASLEDARRLLDQPTPGVRVSGPMGAALLARQSLEAAVQQIWAAKSPELANVTDRAQRITLVAVFDRRGQGRELSDLGRDVAWAWSRLSHLCHHQVYEQNPPATEVAALIDVVQGLVEHLEAEALGPGTEGDTDEPEPR